MITDRSGMTSTEKVFDETPISVKVISGTTAILPCSVDPTYTEMFVDRYQVVWVSPIQTVISLKDRRMINDMRISVERPFLKDWNLHIRNVSIKDSGQYKCQINTEPPRSKAVNLIVQVPPEIQHASSSEIKVVEGENVELVCNATGIPAPTISWYRLNMHSGNEKEHVGTAGEILRIHNISRMCDDTYECVANNSVPPAQYHSTRVNVLFSPEIRLLNSRIGQELGKETILECIITSSPLGYTVWKRNGESLGTSWKYEVDLYNEGEGRVSLSLRIAHVDKDDYGTYTCVAHNQLGTASANMEVYEVYPLTTPTTTSTTVTTKMPERGRYIETPERRGQDPADPYGYNEDLYGNTNNRRRPYIGAGEEFHHGNSLGTPHSTPDPHNRHSGGAQLTGVFGAGEVKYPSSGTRIFFLCFKTCHVCLLAYLIALAAFWNML